MKSKAKCYCTQLSLRFLLGSDITSCFHECCCVPVVVYNLPATHPGTDYCRVKLGILNFGILCKKYKVCIEPWEARENILLYVYVWVWVYVYVYVHAKYTYV